MKVLFKKLEIVGKIKDKNYFRSVSQNISTVEENKIFNFFLGYLMHLMVS